MEPIEISGNKFFETLTGHRKRFGGSESTPFNDVIMREAANAFAFGGDMSEEAVQERVYAGLGAISGLAPQDEIEAMLIAQMMVCHDAIMQCFTRVRTPDQSFEVVQEYLKQANKLLQTSTQLVAALNKHRGKGQQKVIVEHVHVHEGGQAIVGNVEQGRGGKQKRKGQAHAKQVAHAPEPEVRSPLKTDGEPVPAACNGKRTL